MAEPATKHDPYTWDDYLTWPDEERWEIIGGEAFAMSPAPTPAHQRLSAKLSSALVVYFSNKPCEVFPAPCDVKLSETDVVQPDLMIVCDDRQSRGAHIAGAPALAVEILSPSTRHHDRVRKAALYARAGVKEYWLVDAKAQAIEVLRLDGAQYRLHGTFGPGGEPAFSSALFPSLTLNLAAIFKVSSAAAEDDVHEAEAPYEARPPRPPPPRAARART